MSLQGRTALVTGAAGNGIGRSIALTLARCGAKVALNYRTSEAAAQEIAESLKEHGGTAITVKADITCASDCNEMVEAVQKELGPIDICIVNPGAEWHPEPIDQLNAQGALDDILREVAPIYHLMPLLLPHMYECQWGRFIAIALEPSFGSPSYAYNVAKAARSHAMHLSQNQSWPHGVTFNVLGPGPVAALPSLADAIDHAQHGQIWLNHQAISPQDIAEGVAFLCSDAGRFLTGNHFHYAS